MAWCKARLNLNPNSCRQLHISPVDDSSTQIVTYYPNGYSTGIHGGLDLIVRNDKNSILRLCVIGIPPTVANTKNVWELYIDEADGNTVKARTWDDPFATT